MVITTIMNGERKASRSVVMRNHIGDEYVETKTTTNNYYNSNNRIRQRDHYFSVNGYSVGDHAVVDPEFLGAETEYLYDKYNRLTTIYEHHYEESGEKKLDREVKFKYKRKSAKIKAVNVIRDENQDPRELHYKIKYTLNGSLKSIELNDYYNRHYITKKISRN